nr:glycosyltransferase [uncultured Blautia sp.]
MMKRALLINAVCGIRSTGRICTDIAEELEGKGYEVKIGYSRANVPLQFQKYAVRIGNSIDVCTHAFMAKVFDDRGNWSKRATKNFLKWMDDFNPDLVWIHNIHDYVINIKMLFDWLKEHPHIQVKWTQHDCWAFTGGCMHFVNLNCNEWMKGCDKCSNRYSKFGFPIVHKEKENFYKKKEAFLGVNNMTIVTPSKWMANLVKQSFLKNYTIEIQYNSIDKTIFKPTTDSDFRKRYCLESKIIILGVATAWGVDKGLYDFYELAKLLNDEYKIVLVGLTKRQILKLPSQIIGIERTNSKNELAEIYSTADVFVNPTYADNYPTVNLEAEACGTRVICYDVGGCKETLKSNKSKCVKTGDLEALLYEIKTSTSVECD